jgi:hypothetical protein
MPRSQDAQTSRGPDDRRPREGGGPEARRDRLGPRLRGDDDVRATASALACRDAGVARSAAWQVTMPRAPDAEASRTFFGRRPREGGGPEVRPRRLGPRLRGDDAVREPVSALACRDAGGGRSEASKALMPRTLDTEGARTLLGRRPREGGGPEVRPHRLGPRLRGNDAVRAPVSALACRDAGGRTLRGLEGPDAAHAGYRRRAHPPWPSPPRRRGPRGPAPSTGSLPSRGRPCARARIGACLPGWRSRNHCGFLAAWVAFNRHRTPARLRTGPAPQGRSQRCRRPRP